MSVIYIFDGFNTESFEKLRTPSEEDIYNHIDKEGLVDLETKELLNGQNIIDSLIDVFSQIGPLDKPKQNALNYLNKLSERYGNLAEIHGKIDPYFFGFLSISEIKSLHNSLQNMEFEDVEDEENKKLLVGILEKAITRKTGILHWALP